MKYRTKQALKEFNRHAAPFSRISTRDGYRYFKEDLALAHATTGVRRYEMKGYEAKDGHPHIIEF